MSSDLEKYKAFKERVDKLRGNCEGNDLKLKRNYITVLEYSWEDLPNWISNEISVAREIRNRIVELREEGCDFMKLDGKDLLDLDSFGMEIEEIFDEATDPSFGSISVSFDDDGPAYLKQALGKIKRLSELYETTHKIRSRMFQICEGL